MAGGMRRRHGLGTLAERSGRADDSAASTPDPPPPPVRHCWVTGPRGRLAGLLLAWEQRADGWYGRVVHPVEQDDGWVVVEEWQPADRLAPAGP